MSQHRFSTIHAGQPVTVLMGWDRPIGHFFMVIEWDAPHAGHGVPASADDSDAEDDFILYSNLDEPHPFALPIRYFKAKLTELGIGVPEAMFEQVEFDRIRHAGNRHVVYHADGTFHEA
jgi:hypothetical protein